LTQFADRLGLILRSKVVIETNFSLPVVRLVLVVLGGFILGFAESVEFGIDILLGVIGNDIGGIVSGA